MEDDLKYKMLCLFQPNKILAILVRRNCCFALNSMHNLQRKCIVKLGIVFQSKKRIKCIACLDASTY